ncbi:hypothetical protein MN608_09796 [Microdochium nivale]|nr:hypothetical protein MN608_09796 [Microdochium nivale]
MDTPEEYVEIKVTPRGHHKHGISRRVDRARAEASIIIGKDLEGIYPVFIQAAAGSNVSVPITNSLARGARVRATGYKNNMGLQAIPFVGLCRPGALEAAKRHLNGDSTLLDFGGQDWSKEAENRMKRWKEGGPWAPPDQLAHFQQPLLPISMNAIVWGVDEPFDRIPAFSDFQLGKDFDQLIVQLRAKISFDYMTTSQLTVYVMWWFHYMDRIESKLERRADDSYDVVETVPMIIFAILMPSVIRGVEEDGLAFFPNLMSAAVARAQVEFPKSTQEWERLETESKSLQDQISAIFADKEPIVIASLFPGDLIGTKNEAFSDEEVRKTPWANPEVHAMTHYDAVKPTVDLLGDVNTIYMPHPRVQNSALEYRMLIPSKWCQPNYKKVRSRNDLPTLENLNDKKVQRAKYVHIALPGTASTRTDYSALPNKPYHNIFNITDSSGLGAPESSTKNRLHRPGITKTEPPSTDSSVLVKREPLPHNLTALDGLKVHTRPGRSQFHDLKGAKRQCLLPATLSLLSRQTTSNDLTSSNLLRKQAFTAGQAPTISPVNQLSASSTQNRASGPTTEFIHIDQVGSEARRRGWIPPSGVAEAARALGHIDPTNEVDKGKLAVLGFEKPTLRAAPVPLTFRKDEIQTPYFLDLGAQGVRPICTELAHRPSDGVIAAIRTMLLAFTPLTTKLAKLLWNVLDNSSAASDIVALRDFEVGVSELLTICNRVALIDSAVVDARARQPGDPRRHISSALTKGLAVVIETEFGENLPPEFYARLSTCSWTWDLCEVDSDGATTSCTMTDFLRWTRDLQKFAYASAVVIERCCAAVKLGCHESFMPRTRLRLWLDWVRPWQQGGALGAVSTDGPWRLQRKHERKLRDLQQQSASEEVAASSTPALLEPATCLSLETLDHELRCELHATALSDMHGDEDLGVWLSLPCDAGRSVDCSAALGVTEDDGLYLHDGRYWCL